MKLTVSQMWQGVAYIAAVGAWVPQLTTYFHLNNREAGIVSGIAFIASQLLHRHAGNRDQQGNVLPPPSQGDK